VLARVWPEARTPSSTVRNGNHLKIRFSATLDEGPEVFRWHWPSYRALLSIEAKRRIH
jgi:hypothetical protein